MNEIFINVNRKELCETCLVVSEGKFAKKPFCLIIDIASSISLNEIPLSIQIDGLNYNFLNVTFRIEDQNHFQSVFFLNNDYYFVDDMKREITKNIPTGHVFDKIYYYISS